MAWGGKYKALSNLACVQLVLQIVGINIITFPQLSQMRDTLIPEERILAIQEAMCKFIVHKVLDKAGEFYYDGVSNIDNSSKYDKIN